MSDAAALRAYEETVLELPDGARVDLRRPLGDAEREALAALGLGPTLALLTAENPHGEPAEEARGPERRARERDNDRRLSALERDLDARGVSWARVDGTAPDGSHRERLVAVPLPATEATALARRFDQLALFHLDGERFWLLPAEADGEARPLP